MKTCKLVLTLLPVFALLTLPCYADTPVTDNPVFQKNCVRCHGENAHGKFMHAPSLVSKKVNEASVDDLRNIVTNGKGHMPKFGSKLSPEEIDTLVQEIKSMNVK